MKFLSTGQRKLQTRVMGAAVAVLAPVLLLTAVEAGLRVSGYGYRANFFIELDEAGMLSTNPRFGWRFFPKAMARTPLPLRFPARKKEGVVRVFVLGESAAMGFPDPMFSFTHQMQALAGPGYEVINAAMTAIDSHVIREIAAECARLEPDWIIVYAGNNEVIGPYGAVSFQLAARAALMLQRFRFGQLLAPERKAQSQWRGMEMFLDRQVAAGDARLARIYATFEENLTAIARMGRQAGAKVILSTVAVNLKDCPPFAGEQAAGKFRAGDFAGARDLDTLRFRADSRINAIILDVAARTGATLVDAEKLIRPDASSFYEHVHLRPEANLRLASAILGGQAGAGFAATRWDRCRMARTIQALMERPPFPRRMDPGEVEAACAGADPIQARRQYERWRERFPGDLLVRERLAEAMAEAGDHAGAATQWKELAGLLPSVGVWRIGLAESLLAAGKLEEARQAYSEALNLDSRSVAAHVGLGAVAFASGKNRDAERHFREALTVDPNSPEANNNLGRLLESEGKTEQAKAAFRKAVESRPNFAEAHNNLGAALVREGKLEHAAAALSEAVRLEPRLAGAQLNLAGALARLNRSQEAIAHYKAALALKPDSPTAHYELGLALAGQGKVAEAIAHYRECLRLDASHADAENNWGVALARSGRLAEAIPHFEAALRLRPAHAQARRNLESARRGR
jgi:tetratricopeptide (TPR) repeat protein